MGSGLPRRDAAWVTPKSNQEPIKWLKTLILLQYTSKMTVFKLLSSSLRNDRVVKDAEDS